MNEGLKILLARMDSHPEEFILSDFANSWYDGKWSMVIRGLLNRGWMLEAEAAGEPVAKDYISAVPFLSDEEVLLVHRKFMSLQGDAFTASVLRTLLQEPERDNMQAGALISGTNSYPMVPLGAGAGKTVPWQQIAQAYDVNSPEFP